MSVLLILISADINTSFRTCPRGFEIESERERKEHAVTTYRYYISFLSLNPLFDPLAWPGENKSADFIQNLCFCY